MLAFDLGVSVAVSEKVLAAFQHWPATRLATLLDLSEDEKLFILRGHAGLERSGAELEVLQALLAAALPWAKARWSVAGSEA